MTLHGTESIWLADTPPYDAPAPPGPLDVDVAVIGGGIAGITTALLLKRDGARVAVLERGSVAGGATGYTTAKVSALQQTRYSEIRGLHGDGHAAVYAQASLSAIALMERLVEEEGIACDWQEVSAFTYAADASQVDRVEKECEAARAAGLAVELTTDAPLPFAVPAAIRLDGQAQFHPVRYVRALAGLVAGDGSHVLEGAAVTGVEHGSPCRVRTAGGAIVTAGDVVVCTNYPLLDRGLFFARMEATRSYLVAARIRGAAPEGASISAGAPTRSIRAYRQGADTWVLVGGEGHTTGSSKARPERYERLEAFAREHFDVLDVPYRWSTQDGMPTDKLPYAGRYTPVSDHLFVNCGGQKWGMTNATIGAMIIADRLGGRDNAYADVFDPNRVSVRAAPRTARAQAWVGAHFVGARLAPAEVSSSAEVPLGEARVVGSRAHKVGVFRDDHGELHAVSLRCTHLGCIVGYNEAERTWDCPCHGSRYDVDGNVLAGPAVRPLERRDAPA